MKLPKFDEYKKMNEGYNSDLPDEFKEFLYDELEECVSSFSDWEWKDPEEVESKMRDGFIPFTDGGMFVTAWSPISNIIGSGTQIKFLQKDIDKYESDAYNYAEEEIINRHPELKDIGFGIDYSSLYDNDMGEIAEEFSELQNSYNDDIAVTFKMKVLYYDIENDHGEYTNKSESLHVSMEFSTDPYYKNVKFENENIKVDFSTPKGIKKAEKDVSKVIKKLIKKI